ncbi:MAG: substrate-binding domain-containing protein [Spirochaetes bacterium]|nr:substrate-binding domain-containing protein [Spirochaetota bacterium]
MKARKRRRLARQPDCTLRHAWLARELEAELKRANAAPHAPFLSENLMRRRFDVSLQTVRRALLDLEQRGLIYRIPRKGTFVAPPRKRARLLIYLPNLRPRERDWIQGTSGDSAFFLNALDRAAEPDLPFELNFEAKRETLLARVDDLPLTLPGLAAVVVFREYAALDILAAPLARHGIPLLFYGSSAQRARCRGMAGLFYDETRVTRLALEHLWSLGHRRIGCVWVPTHHAQIARHQAWLAWHEERGLPIEPSLDLPVEYATVADAVATRDGELRRTKRPWTALFSTDDQFLPYVLRALRAQGTMVPGDLSVVGVNNSPGCRWCDPMLTAVDLPLDADGRRMVELAALAVRGERPHWESEVSLVVRESTAPVA